MQELASVCSRQYVLCVLILVAPSSICLSLLPSRTPLTMLVSYVPLPGAVKNFLEAASTFSASFHCHGYYWPCVLNSLRGGLFG